MIEVDAIKDKRKIQDLKAYLKKKNPRDYLLATLGFNTGLRISDLLPLTIKDAKYILENEKITLKEKKTKKTRTVYINKTALKHIKSYLKTLNIINEEHYLFKSKKGNHPIDRKQAWRIINDAAKEVGIKGKIGTHSMRKSFGYHSVKNGVSIELLQKTFNHSSPLITLAYIGITSDDMKEACNKIAL